MGSTVISLREAFAKGEMEKETEEICKRISVNVVKSSSRSDSTLTNSVSSKNSISPEQLPRGK